MRKLFSIAISVLVICASTASATSIGFFPGFTGKRTVLDASGTALTSANSLVLVGTFSNANFTLNSQLSLAANVAAITATPYGWNQFGYDSVTNTLNNGVVSTLGINSTGNVSGQETDNNFGATQADFFNGKLLYLWVFNAPTVGAATQMGIYRATSAAAPWVFPSNAGGVNDNPTLSTTSAATPTIAAIGLFGSASTSALQLTNSFSVTAVPEPSTLAFGLLVAVVAGSSRNRRKTK